MDSRKMIFSEKELSIKNLMVEHIMLDLFNPRFHGDKTAPKFSKDIDLNDDKAQELTRRYLIEKQGANSLVASISRMGFLKLDRIVVREFLPNNYVVVEGNRRLAAIKTLIGNVRRRVTELPESVIESLSRIEVLLLESSNSDINNSALLLQGLRHISGVKNWGPYQQGKLIHTLVEGDGMNFSEAALAVGLSPGRVSTLLRSYCGLNQMSNSPEFSSFADVNLFSCFEQAYVKVPVRIWLGWSEQEKSYMNLAALSFFYKQIVHDNGGPKLIAREVRDRLPVVLEHKEARSAYLEEKSSLKEAFLLTQPHKEYMEPFLNSASGLMNCFKGGLQQPDLNVEDRALLEKIHLFTGKILQKQSV